MGAVEFPKVCYTKLLHPAADFCTLTKRGDSPAGVLVMAWQHSWALVYSSSVQKSGQFMFSVRLLFINLQVSLSFPVAIF